MTQTANLPVTRDEVASGQEPVAGYAPDWWTASELLDRVRELPLRRRRQWAQWLRWKACCLEGEPLIRRRRPRKPAWTEWLGWLATCIAVSGVLLNNERSPWCFAVWLVSNSLTAAIHLRSRLWALTVRDLIFTGLAVVGWWRWTT